MMLHDDETNVRAAEHQSTNGMIQAGVTAEPRPVHEEMPDHFPDKDFA
jgi:hypothetical protein